MKRLFYDPFFDIDNLENFTSFHNNKKNYGNFPKVDLYEEGQNYFIEMEVPGYKKEDIKITLKENLLSIGGEKEIDRNNTQRKYYLTERHGGKFVRNFTLGEGIDTNNIEASFENGVLTIKLNKVVPTQPEIKTIEIK